MKSLIERVPNIEGLLKVSVETDGEEGRVLLQSGRTLHMEGRLFGKSPLEAVQLTQTLSAKNGVAHGLAAALALENFLQIKPTYGGQKIRQIMLQLSTLHAHISHFYFEVLPDYLNQRHFKAQGLLRASFFPALAMREEAPGDLGHESGRLILSHLPQVVTCLGKLQQCLGLLGGKFPIVMNLIPGGVTNQQVSRDQVMRLLRLLEGIKQTVEVTWPGDLRALIGATPELAQGLGENQQLISFGSMDIENAKDDPSYYTSGVYLDGKLEPLNAAKVTESFVDTYYRSADNKSLSNDLIYDLNKKEAKTWIKAARYEIEVMQTGPLARMLVTHYGGGNVQISDSISAWIEDLGLSSDRANSAASRLLAEAFEGRFLMLSLFKSLMGFDFSQKLNLQRPLAFSGRGTGTGLVEAPSGSLMHQVFIGEGAITGYRIVAPANWTLSSRDEFGKTGLVESELNRLSENNPIKPLTANRILHSYYAMALDATQ
ncbi:MAG: nickel-dependent hydrogenase large subunit [bacterium]|nr:nickel-dependent hydrogenase large subunit [bacterium]